MRRVLSPQQRLWVISTLLVALVVRALIPAGFMPATDRPFSFQVCPDGFPAALLGEAAMPADGDALAHAGHHHHTGAFAAEASPVPAPASDSHGDGLLAFAHDGPAHNHNHSSANAEHCVFAAAAGAFAFAFAATFSAPAASISAPDVDYVSPAFQSHRFRLPQPRGPPAHS